MDTRRNRDPLALNWIYAAAFYFLGLVRLGTPSTRYFDEMIYVPAAARLLLGMDVINREHPMLAKELIALSLWAFGNGPIGWRIGSLVAATIGLLALIRTVWWLSQSRLATNLFGLLLVTSFMHFALARAAVLDPFMFGFIGLAVLFLVRSIRSPDHFLLFTGLAGAFIGLAVACKWLAIPVHLGMVLTYAWLNRQSWPRLLQGACLLGLLPLALYFLSFLPGMFVKDDPLTLSGLLPLQFKMASMLHDYTKVQAYASQWWQWMLNLKPFWMLHDTKDGAFRLIVLGGNPLTMLAVLPALALSLWHWIRKGDWLVGVPSAFYVLFLAFPALSGRQTQYFHYYLLPFTFALAVLAIQLARLWDNGRRWPAWAIAIGSTALFAWFYPALSAAPLPNHAAEARYSWLPGWQPAEKKTHQSDRVKSPRNSERPAS